MMGGMKKPGMSMPGTGGINTGMRQPLPAQAADRAREAIAAAMMKRSMKPMAAQQIMPNGRAFAKGGMVGCGYTPKSSATMRGAARKGK